jgi:hypothetical protein
MSILSLRSGKNVEDIFPISSRNGITKEYYDFLVGEINRGVNMQDKAVATVLYSKAHDYIGYHLVSSY